jgi:predicted RNase H-like HicB family nuclease
MKKTRAKNNGRKRKRYHLPVLVEQDEDGVFVVSVPTLLGCRSYGYTLEEAMENIAEAAALCLETEKPSSGGTFVGVRDLEIVA